jgi:hypothetical protein
MCKCAVVSNVAPSPIVPEPFFRQPWSSLKDGSPALISTRVLSIVSRACLARVAACDDHIISHHGVRSWLSDPTPPGLQRAGDGEVPRCSDSH